jgi:hypothetical protein
VAAPEGGDFVYHPLEVFEKRQSPHDIPRRRPPQGAALRRGLVADETVVIASHKAYFAAPAKKPIWGSPPCAARGMRIQ